jgi:hypothetical protein
MKFPRRSSPVPTLRIFGFIATLAWLGGWSGGCGGDESAASNVLEHRFDAIDVARGEEIPSLCQSWTLNNEEDLYVTSVVQENDGGWHHSNWFFVPEDIYAGPDGTWRCSERGFTETEAGLEGGVFFAQSTQSLVDTQAFPEGMALRIPARSRIVGNVHLLNATAKDVRTTLAFTVKTAATEDVTTRLYPVSFTNLALDLEPNAESRFAMDCDIGGSYRNKFDRDPDFNIVYVLPHYHELGNYFLIEAVDPEGNARTVFEKSVQIGDPSGETLDPLFAMDGDTRLRVTCGYENPRSTRVGYGVGDQEMCVFLAYIDAPIKIAGTALNNEALGPDSEGIFQNNSPCAAVGF